MGWINNRMLRVAANRSHQRIARNVDGSPATAALALAMGHACYPNAMYGDHALQEEILIHLKHLSPRSCNAKLACKHVEAWLDSDTLSTSAAFNSVWGMSPDVLLDTLLNSFED